MLIDAGYQDLIAITDVAANKKIEGITKTSWHL
jgi:hypothetical protein